jgi:hypothetical protein
VQDGSKRVIVINIAEVIPGFYSIDIITDDIEVNEEYEDDIE